MNNVQHAFSINSEPERSQTQAMQIADRQSDEIYGDGIMHWVY